MWDGGQVVRALLDAGGDHLTDGVRWKRKLDESLSWCRPRGALPPVRVIGVGGGGRGARQPGSQTQARRANVLAVIKVRHHTGGREGC